MESTAYSLTRAYSPGLTELLRDFFITWLRTSLLIEIEEQSLAVNELISWKDRQGNTEFDQLCITGDDGEKYEIISTPVTIVTDDPKIHDILLEMKTKHNILFLNVIEQ